MTNGLSIKRTAELYGISIDTLYYYEKIGLVVPARNAKNSYRVYGPGDFARLNMVSSMLRMNFNLTQIRRYLEHHDLATNVSLINSELDAMDSEIRELLDKRSQIRASLGLITTALLKSPEERIEEFHCAERPYLWIADSPFEADDIPRLCAERAQDLRHELDIFHSTSAFIIDTGSIDDEGTYSASSLLLYNQVATGLEQNCFPAGRYLSATFRGSAARTPLFYQRMMEYMKEHELRQLDAPVEFWPVSEYNSDDENEFIHTSRFA